MILLFSVSKCSHHMKVEYSNWNYSYLKSIQCPHQKYASWRRFTILILTNLVEYVWISWKVCVRLICYTYMVMFCGSSWQFTSIVLLNVTYILDYFAYAPQVCIWCNYDYVLYAIHMYIFIYFMSSAKAFCFRAVHSPHSSICPERSCYHSVLWMAWTVSLRLH